MGALELAMVVASALLHATWGASIKGSRDPLAFNVAQSTVTVALGLPLIPWLGLGLLPQGVWWLVAATGVAHGAYWYGLSRALTESDLSLTYPIIRSTPAFLPFVAVPLLGEQLSVAGGLGIAIVVAGIWALRGSAPAGAPAQRSLHIAYFTLVTTVAYSLLDKQVMAVVSDGPWSAAVPRSLVVYYLVSAAGLLGFLPLALPRMERGAVPARLRQEGGRVLGAVAIGVVGYGLILEAYRTAPASYVVAVRQLSVLFALVLAVAFFRERPTRRRVVGAVATVAGVVLIALRG